MSLRMGKLSKFHWRWVQMPQLEWNLIGTFPKRSILRSFGKQIDFLSPLSCCTVLLSVWLRHGYAYFIVIASRSTWITVLVFQCSKQGSLPNKSLFRAKRGKLCGMLIRKCFAKLRGPRKSVSSLTFFERGIVVFYVVFHGFSLKNMGLSNPSQLENLP